MDRIEALNMLRESQSRIVRELRQRYSTDDYVAIRVVGKGSFGVVSLVCCKRSGNQYALKSIRKDRMLKKNHRERLLAEKSLLAGVACSDWVVQLCRTFQDQHNLFMVMEYLPGGNLMSHLIKHGRFSESATRFYISQLVEAVHSIHRMGFIHRDIKPDNIVLSRDGHVKLIDFGLCKFDPSIQHEAIAADNRMTEDNGSQSACILQNRSRREFIKSFVGTPQYMAPEVLTRSYDHTSDFWSVGMIAYECLMGGTPFYDEVAEEAGGNNPCMKRILHKVSNYEKYLPIPFPGVSVSEAAVSFLRGLLCPAQYRFRYDQIRTHAFFKGVDWSRLKSMKAPIIPKESRARQPDDPSNKHQLPKYEPLGILKDRNLDFVGYTYNKFSL